ncbi:MAG TPA: hypothetical protein VIN57_01320 [Magnetovibrio sp.]
MEIKVVMAVVLRVGIVIAKSIGTVFNPVGKKRVSEDSADAVRIREAQAQLARAS